VAFESGGGGNEISQDLFCDVNFVMIDTWVNHAWDYPMVPYVLIGLPIGLNFGP